MADPLEYEAPHGDHFATALQERRADLLGLWLFLATEVMMFGGLFMSVVVYRATRSEAVEAGAQHLNLWLGGLNTAVLLTSSLTVALAVVEARRARPAACVRLLLVTIGLGLLFLGIKGVEYTLEYHEGLIPGLGPPFPLEQEGTQLFFNLYFAATGLHAVHLIIAVVYMGVIAWRLRSGRTPLPQRRITVEAAGLYWHFVDVVWVFLYPVLYLVGR